TNLEGSGLFFFWDLDRRREARRVAENVFGSRSACFSPDGSLLVTAARDRILLWDAAHRVPLPDNTANGPGIRSLALAADGGRVVTGGDDGLIRVWNVATGAEQARFPGRAIISATFSPDGARLLVAEGSGTTRLIDAATGAEVWSLGQRAPYAPARLSP